MTRSGDRTLAYPPKHENEESLELKKGAYRFVQILKLLLKQPNSLTLNISN